MLPQRQAGFTLVEVLIALLMSGLIFGAIYSTSEKQQEVYVRQDQVVAVQDNLRAAMHLMAREIRLAGYDPSRGAGSTIVAASQGSLNFTMDTNANGQITPSTSNPGEDVTYELYINSGISFLGRQSPSLNRAVAEHIQNLEFFYTLEDGSQTLAPASADLTNIRAVQVTVLARSATMVNDTTGTNTMTTPGGQTWSMDNRYLWRNESMTVVCRNMGL